ncbi:hypothetical protein T4A_10024 [Trichinella pseudospiralis]|uniref:Uncharacterized protein n=1 Tax=Trichinella pseudospiralis TaxID=6337 RepID=A0A0V1DLP6_TRIPS|nr:hypothetical protein T4A_10024 [Trichinella pseudospiralis]
MLIHCGDVSFLKLSREVCNQGKPKYSHYLLVLRKMAKNLFSKFGLFLIAISSYC